APAEPPPPSEPVAPAESATYNLRGTPMKGRTRHLEVNLDVMDAQLAFKVGPIVVPGTMTLQVRCIDDLEILDVSDGMVRQGRLTHVVDKTTTTMQMSIPGGEAETESEEEFGELHGRTELIELNDGQWTRTLVGAAPSANLVAELQAAPTEDALYPVAIKIGESWTVPGSELRHWTGSDFTLARGQLKRTLRAVEVVSAETIATIDGVGELGGKIRDGDGKEMDMTMTIQVTERRSLERAMEIEMIGKGTIQLSGTFLEDGLPVSLSVTGPLTLQIKGSLL
ncbi:MAG TPA: hypothetical protein VGB85_02710, partial [Nannocystis sp.]